MKLKKGDLVRMIRKENHVNYSDIEDGDLGVFLKYIGAVGDDYGFIYVPSVKCRRIFYSNEFEELS